MLRKIIFWSHLVCGVAAGLMIGIMSFTGAALTFEKDIIAWAERDTRRVPAPAPAAVRLGIDEAVARALAAKPDLRINNVTVSADPQDALILGLPGNAALAVNPHTGEAHAVTAPRMRAFMQMMRAWHLRLNFKPGPGNAGAMINAAANLIFVFLAVSGLVIWWPRIWQWRVLRPSLWFTRAEGKARDWNWHNVIGFWTLPLILVLAGSGVVLSYKWANTLVFQLAGEQPPPNLIPPAPPPLNLQAPPAGATPLTSDAAVAAVQKAYPEWSLVTVRFNPPRTTAPAAGAKPPRTLALVVKEKAPWPRFNQPTVTLDAYSGEIVRTEGYATLSPGMQARRWVRLLHSGEAMGRFVQLLSGLACLGGCVLVYTGFALTWRRFFGSQKGSAT
ncbi:MAG: PepSY-associated TM helix domain-containing protein [Opitutaceae bacterium]